MLCQIDERELTGRILKNWQRLQDDYYQIDQVFQPASYGWPGDIEGRALLAFVSHAQMHGLEHPAMHEMVRRMPEKMNAEGYFGPLRREFIHEQQLSGHSWLLRGLCGYVRLTGSAQARALADRIVEALYLPLWADYETYPTQKREKTADSEAAGVLGHCVQVVGRWQLSSDVGCAFMSLDGLSDYYALTGRAEVLALLRRMTERFGAIDKEAAGLQTHCTLTAGRGMMRLYTLTQDPFYLEQARGILALYRKSGMTDTYQNLNWWGRPDSWTEPCAIIDSLMLALDLYKATGQEDYRTFAARVYRNGFSTLQRANGGAGTDKVVCAGQPILSMRTYEAKFCCSMRLAEGLRCICENREALAYRQEAPVRDEKGRYLGGDVLYGQLLSPDAARWTPYLEPAVSVDGRTLTPIPKLYRIPDELGRTLQMRILFE